MGIIKPLAQVGSDVIRATAKKVSFPLSRAARATIEDLIDTLNASQLVGIAAPQIGKSLRIFITYPRKTEARDVAADKIRIFINPEIVTMDNDYSLGYEGCGSVGESSIFGEVYRSNKLELRFFDVEGIEHKEVFKGFLARIIQHELDHLNGVVFVDRLSSTKTLKSRSEFISKKKPA